VRQRAVRFLEGGVVEGDDVRPVADKHDDGPAQRVGTVIKGKWHIDALLGVGGMAAVYAASHRNGQRAALKILHIDFAREKTICERFLREAYVSNKVGHPACVAVLDDDQTEEGEPFLVMELLEGETVRDAWKKAGRTMPAVQVLQIADRVLDCLSNCHAIGVIHRDLKPANIFITNKGQIKVLDFGVAQMRSATAERTATGTALGTPAYMSPEQAMGLVDQLDGRADIFSVGAMMHALITGHRINNGRTEQEALVMAATKPVPSVARIAPDLPIEVIKIIDKSLAWDRRNRYADAREMQKAVVTALQNLGGVPLTAEAGPQQALPTAPHSINAPNAATATGQVAVAPAQVVAPTGPRGTGPMPGAAAPPPPQAPVQLVAPTVAPPAQQPAAQQAPVAPVLQQPIPAPGVPAAARRSASMPPVAGTAPEVPESDPRVQELRDLMKHVERLLPSVRQFGWQHPATERTLRTAFEAFAEALARNPRLVSMTIRPYMFLTLGHAVWEPSPPFDAIPYNLFAAGMRTLRVNPGVTMQELRDLLTLMMLDPGRDLPPEDDIAAAFWEKGLQHVQYDCVDAFAEGDADEREAFYGEADRLEAMAQDAAKQHANRIEAKAMAVSTDDQALVTNRATGPMSLDDVVRAVFSNQMNLSRDKWSERYVDALIEGYLDAAQNRDAPLVLASLRKSAADLVVAGRIEVALSLHSALSDRLNLRITNPNDRAKLVAALTNAMFGGENLEIVLKTLKTDQQHIAAFANLASVLSPNELPGVLAGLREPLPPALRGALLTFLERALPNREQEVAAACAGMDPEIAVAVIGLLGRANTPGARQALVTLSQSEDVGVRMEVRVLLAQSPEQAQTELASALENPSALVRMAALRAIARYGMRGTWSTIQRLVRAKEFDKLGSDERKELLRALVVLSPERGEPIAIELAKKGGIVASDDREATRVAAAEVLGELSRSATVAAALTEVSQARWGTSDETRSAAAAAAKQIQARIEGGAAPLQGASA
jgi:hypothetical protein